MASRNDQTRELRFWYGGYQAGNWATGGPWFVENVVEELTVPGEWFFDPDSRQLFVHPNGTAESLRSGLEAVRLETLLRVEGSPDQAVQHLVLRGLQFEHTSTTFLQPYVMPSGGDYRIFNGGAVVLTEAEMVTFDHNTFSDLGGNGIARKTCHSVIAFGVHTLLASFFQRSDADWLCSQLYGDE